MLWFLASTISAASLAAEIAVARLLLERNCCPKGLPTPKNSATSIEPGGHCFEAHG
jgi:hypothetical protein